jgi:hypothetical protein
MSQRTFFFLVSSLLHCYLCAITLIWISIHHIIFVSFHTIDFYSWMTCVYIYISYIFKLILRKNLLQKPVVGFELTWSLRRRWPRRRAHLRTSLLSISNDKIVEYSIRNSARDKKFRQINLLNLGITSQVAKIHTSCVTLVNLHEVHKYHLEGTLNAIRRKIDGKTNTVVVTIERLQEKRRLFHNERSGLNSKKLAAWSTFCTHCWPAQPLVKTLST